VKAAHVAAALVAKGMVMDDNHHHMFRKSVEGVTTLVTRISHNSKEIHDSLARTMARQCALSLKEFQSLVECSLSQEDWDELIIDRCTDGKNPFIN
jgi:hypothetical protein